MDKFSGQLGARFSSTDGEEKSTVESDEWRKAREAIEHTRRRKADESTQAGGKSLYETLQANKVAKQEAFEESIKLRNQFRSLDEDEAEFLDTVLESTRAREAAIKKETSEQLESFRKNQEQADRAAALRADESSTIDPSQPAEDSQESWTVGNRKRKKGKSENSMGIKLRKTSSSGNEPFKASLKAAESPTPPKKSAAPTSSQPPDKVKDRVKETSSPKIKPPDSKPASKTGSGSLLGLGAYSSDEE
ncbi:MAG: hypothetical protein M1814_003041 [Vezdaea aestivalis]|nr:MAG: hypothetical protein M1814_003041 [Vezdaea aestivalis]